MVVKRNTLNFFLVILFLFISFLFFFIAQKYNYQISLFAILLPFLLIFLFFYSEIGLNFILNEPLLYFILPILPIAEGFKRASLALFTFLILLIAFVYQLVKEPRIINHFISQLKKPLFILLVIIGITLFISVIRLPLAFSEYGYVKFFSFLLLAFLPCLALLFFGGDEKRLKRFIFSFALFIFLFFVYANFLIMKEGIENFLEKETIPYRLGFSLSCVVFGRWAGIGILLSLLLFITVRNKLVKIIVLLFLPILLYLLLLSATRGAILAVGITLFTFFFLKLKNFKEKLALIILFTFLFFIFYSFIPSIIKERLTYFEDESALNRLEFIGLAFQNFFSSPLLGKGLGTFPYYNYHALYPHNIFAEFACETGFFGLIPFLFFIIFAFKEMLKKLRAKEITSLFPAFLFLYLFIQSQFSFDIGNNYLLFFAGIFLSLKEKGNEK